MFGNEKGRYVYDNKFIMRFKEIWYKSVKISKKDFDCCSKKDFDCCSYKEIYEKIKKVY